MKYKDKPQAQNQEEQSFFDSDRYWRLYYAAINEDNMYSAAEIEDAQIELADRYLAAGDIDNACEYYGMAAEHNVLVACKMASLFEDRIAKSENRHLNFDDPIKGYYCMAAIAYEDIIDTMSPRENQQYIKQLPYGAEKYMNAVLFKHFPELGIPDADAEYDISDYLNVFGKNGREEWLKRAAEHGNNDAKRLFDSYYARTQD